MPPHLHTNVFTYFFAFLGTLFCIWLLKPLSEKLGFVDLPGGHKQHKNEVPLIGGIAVFFGFYFALLSMPISLQSYRGLIGASALILLVGVADDLLDLNAKMRLLIQGFAAIFAVYADGLQISFLGAPFFTGPIIIGQYGILLAIFVIVGYLNAFNMLDGQDGLAGSVGIGQILLLAYLLNAFGGHIEAHVLLLLGTALFVFLCFNFPLPWRKQASIFLGNAGSGFLAITIAWFAILTCQKTTPFVEPITFLWILAYPIFDLISVSFHRIRTGRSPLIASRDHLHHVLQNRQWSTLKSTLFLSIGSFALGIVGILLNDVLPIQGINTILYILALIFYVYQVEKLRTPKS